MFESRIFNSGFGYECRKPAASFAAAKAQATKDQRKAGYGWTAEVLKDGVLVAYRPYQVKQWSEKM